MLGSPMPNSHASLSLAGIVVGGLGYMYFDNGFKLESYFWGMIYLVSMTLESLVIKRILTSIKLTPWGLVLYNNVVRVTT